MNRNSVVLVVLFALVTLAGFVTGALFQEAPDARAVVAMLLTGAVAVLAAAIASRQRARALERRRR
jgi:hypothetical protein